MTGAALSEAQALCLARWITGNRLAVAAVHDRIAAEAGPGHDDFKTIALDTRDTVEAYQKAMQLASAATPPWHDSFLAGLAALGMIDLDAALKEGSTPENPIVLMPQSGGDTVIEAQAFSETTSRTLKMGDLLNAFSLAARRLCLIDGGTRQGTGFLIGPHTVLTNYHVMEQLIDPATRSARAGSAQKIRISFETLEKNQGRICLPAEDWLVGCSPMQADVAIADPTGDCLDFCAIRLRGAPGRERGWYDLAKTGELENANDAFFVFQHPEAWPQRVGFAVDTVVDTDTRFLRHLVGTANGSSGGLCLDNQLRPIGLHHAAVSHATEKDANGKAKFLYNRAVQLSAIHAARPDLGNADATYDKIFRLPDGSKAVVGRPSTQETLRRMAAGKGPPILVIKGAKLSGKSFTTDLLRGSFPFESLKIIELSASDLTAQAVDLARLILDKAGADLAEVDRAFARLSSLTTGTATVADIFATMKTMLLAIARASPVQPFTLWLVLDELDKVQLPQISARTLLEKIYGDAELLAAMRVMLIGLTSTLTSVNPALISTEPLDDPSRLREQDVEDCLAGLMVDAGLAPSVGEARKHAALILGATDALDANSRQSTPLAVLSGLLSSVYMKAVQSWR